MSQSRRLAAILAVDVVGYSRLMGADEEGTLERLKALRHEVIEPNVAKHHGRIVKTTGDGLLVEFASVVDAVRYAAEVQQAMPHWSARLAADRRIELRIGINLGDVIVDGDDLYGDGVNIAARLEALADAGGVFVSGTVYDQVRDRLPFGFEDRGEQQVKNIARPIRVYRVLLDEMASVPVKTPLPLPHKPSVAVLPFQNMSGDPEQEYFADGVVEEITTAIAHLSWLFVIARNSSFTYKGRSVDVKKVGLELGVRYVLQGSVRKAGNRVRIAGQLIDTTGGVHIWADRFEGVLDDIFALQDEVASSVAGAIEPRLKLAEIERARRNPTNSLSAYDLYLRALAEFRKPGLDNCELAVDLLRRALGVDPSYAPAAGLIAYVRRHQYVMGVQLSADDVADALRVARHAIAVGKNDPDALWMGGHTLALMAGDHATATSAIEQAIAINPNCALAWWALGSVNCFVNRPDAAIAATQRAIRLSPLDPVGFQFEHMLGFGLMLAGRYEEAINHVNRALRDRPDYQPALRAKLALCGYLGRVKEGHDFVRRLLEANPAMTIAGFGAFVATHHVPETTAVFVEGFRRAGLPEK